MTARRDTIRVTLGDGSAWGLRFDVNALCDFEAAMQRAGFDPVRELERLERQGRPPITAIRALIWACARFERPALTEAEVGALLGDGENGRILTDAAFRAMAAASPPRNESAAPDEGAPPEKT